MRTKSLNHDNREPMKRSNGNDKSRPQLALDQAIQDAGEREMCEAAALLALDPDITDVEFAFAAQSEAILSDK